uniref:Uncharacterized protein n=1 Tax=Rhodnius prolixus TaxID=13249 RepID=T1ID22_RHOPR
MSSDNSGTKLPEDGEAASETKVEPEDSHPSETVPKVSRLHLSDEQLTEISLEELRSHWRQQDSYINLLESRSSTYEGRSPCALRYFIVLYILNRFSKPSLIQVGTLLSNIFIITVNIIKAKQK